MAALHKGGDTSPDVFIAIPAYGGIVGDFVRSLHESVQLLERNQIKSCIRVYEGNCHVDDSRNYLVREFLESDCDTFVFLDADLGWRAQDFLELVTADRPIVAGIYPMKQDPPDYPVHTPPGEIWSDADGFVEALAVPTGFLKIQREVLEKLDEGAVHHKLKTDSEDRKYIPIIFERTVQRGARWGGDYTFCLKAQSEGYKLYVKPEWYFNHYGSETWYGSVGGWWMEMHGGNDAVLRQALNEIASGQYAKQSYDAVKAWGNLDFVGPPSLVAAACELGQKNSPVLECGSGITSLAMAAAGVEVHCLEHSPVWATELCAKADKFLTEDQRKNLHIHFCPLKDYGEYEWYDFDPEGEWGMVVCDGPPRTGKGGRQGIEKVLPYLKGPILMDDTNSGDWFMSLPVDWQRLDRRVSIGYSTECDRQSGVEARTA